MPGERGAYMRDAFRLASLEALPLLMAQAPLPIRGLRMDAHMAMMVIIMEIIIEAAAGSALINMTRMGRDSASDSEDNQLGVSVVVGSL